MDSGTIAHFTPRGVAHQWGTRNGVYYYLGGVASHLAHALPVYKKIGGTCIVTSRSAYDFCVKSNVAVVMLDDNPELFLQFEKKQVKKTIEYINTHARVVLYYEIFSINEWINVPQIMFAHGVGFKDYYIEWRQEYLKYFTYIAGLGPFWEERILTQGVKKKQLARVGVSRMDTVMNIEGRVLGRRTLARRLGLDPAKPIISYMPTWWGPTSVNDTGKTIIRMLSERYSLIFRPHPSTPLELIREYEDIIATEKLNTVYFPDGKYKDVSIDDVYRASSAFIIDLSSVSIEAMMTDKPLLFAFGGSDRDQGEAIYDPIKNFYDMCEHITKDNAYLITESIERALRTKMDIASLNEAKALFTYDIRGTATEQTVELVKKTVSSSAV